MCVCVCGLTLITLSVHKPHTLPFRHISPLQTIVETINDRMQFILVFEIKTRIGHSETDRIFGDLWVIESTDFEFELNEEDTRLIASHRSGYANQYFFRRARNYLFFSKNKRRTSRYGYGEAFNEKIILFSSCILVLEMLYSVQCTVYTIRYIYEYVDVRHDCLMVGCEVEKNIVWRDDAIDKAEKNIYKKSKRK